MLLIEFFHCVQEGNWVRMLMHLIYKGLDGIMSIASGQDYNIILCVCDYV